MDIVINLQPIFDFISQPLDIMLWRLFWTIGWIPVAVVFIWGTTRIWLFYIQLKWFLTHKFIYLAIDIPRGNQQSPKAVENIFAYLAGAHSTFDLHERWWEGQFQLSMSFEIVSIEGYIQYIIRAPEQWRNLVESAIYSQYPDAEITEINDYTQGYPTQFPDEQYDLWGGEFKLVYDPVLPIKVYKEFEYTTIGDPDTYFKDPMAALMDLMSSLRKGEQIWYQILIIPIDVDWSFRGDEVIKKIIGEKMPAKKNIIDKIGDGLIKGLGDLSELIYSIWGDIQEKKEEEKEINMMNLRPRQKKQVEAIQEKVGKVGYGFKMRFVYLAKKEVMNKTKAANGFIGYMKQYNTNDLNSFKPDVGNKGTATKVNYPFFKEARLDKRKRNIMRFYKTRDAAAGRSPGILNTEELATVWHFPVERVAKAPLIQKAPGRKSEPPASLPMAPTNVSRGIPFGEAAEAEAGSLSRPQPAAGGVFGRGMFEAAGLEKGAPPANLPFAE